MISIEAYRAAIGHYYNKSKRLSNIDEFNTNMSCFFSAYLNYLLLHFNRIFGLFLLEFYDSSFLKRFKLLIDGDIESNPGPVTNTPKGRPRKSGSGFRGTPKVKDEKNVNLENISKWLVSCPSKNLMSNPAFEVNSQINAKISLWKGDITKIEVDAIMNAAKESLLGGSGIDEAIHNAAGSKLLEECRTFPVIDSSNICKEIRCKTGECKVTQGYNLPANYVFHVVGPRDKNEDELRACYENCLENIIIHQTRSIAFCCIATGYFGFKRDHKKAAEIALSTTRKWLESNHESVDRIIFCMYENEDFKIYEGLMSTLYFPVSNNINVTINCNKSNDSNNASCSTRNVEILDKSIIGKGPNSISSATSIKKKHVTDNNTEIDFNANHLLITNASNPNIPLGLRNEGVQVCFFNSVIQVLYSLQMFRNYIYTTSYKNRYITEIRKLFETISNQGSNEAVTTSVHLRKLRLNNYIFKDQYDAQECLINILENCYGNSDACIFQFNMLESRLCNYEDKNGIRCGYLGEPTESHKDLQLHVEDTKDFQSIQTLLNMKMMNERGTLLPDYECPKCKQEGSTTKATSFASEPDVLIIQLVVYDYKGDGSIEKLHPNLIIDDEIQVYSSMTLQGIIYHDGPNTNSGHYTSRVKINNKWFNISDENVYYEQSQTMEPYILVYKKKNEVVVYSPPVLSTPTNVSDENSRSTYEPISVNVKAKNMDLDPIVLNDISAENSVNMTAMTEVICVRCNSIITVTDGKRTTIKCTSCNFRSRVSDLKCAQHDSPGLVLNPESMNRKSVQELSEIDNDDNINNKFNIPKQNKHDVSRINREKLLKELNTQNQKVSNAENQRKRRDLLLNEIKLKKEEILHVRKEKRNLKASSDVLDSKDKLLEQLNVYNQMIKNAQNEIQSKEATLKEIDKIRKNVKKASPENEEKSKELNTQSDKINTSTKRKASEMSHVSDEKVNTKRDAKKADATYENEVKKYNFNKKKAKFTDKHALQDKALKRKSYATDEGKLKNLTRAKEGMSKIRKTDDGKEKNRKAFEELLKTLEGKAKNRTRVSKLLKTPEGKEKNRTRVSEIRKTDMESRENAFEEVQGMSMVDPSILRTDAYEILSTNWQNIISKGPEYTCAICIKQEWKTNVLNLNPVKYKDFSKMFNTCYKGKHYWLEQVIEPEIFKNRFEGKEEYICKGCDGYLKKGKMPPQCQANGLQLNRIEDELKDLCPLELMLISQIIPFMYIVAKHKGAQFGLKGQCVLVPADLKKIEKSLPRPCDDNCVISLALKRRLSDQSYHRKQNIRPAKVNKALEKLKEINHFYNNVSVDDSWENLSKESDPELWDLLTNENAQPDKADLIDSDEEIEGNDHALEREKRDTAVPYPTVLHNIDGMSVRPGEILNIAPGEGQIPVSFTSEPEWEPLAYPKEFPLGKGHFNDEKQVRITPSQYVHTRLKCADDRFANNARYIFTNLDWIERNAIWSSITFAENKRFQGNVTAEQVRSSCTRRMLSDQQIYYTFKNIRGTPQFANNHMLDVLAKVRRFGCYTFFLTLTAGIPHSWHEIIQILGRQYGKNFTTEDVVNMSNQEKTNWLKRNPVTVARQVDYAFTKCLGPAVIMSGMHPIGQILNFDEKREFQNRGVEHPHCAYHVIGAPKLDESPDIEIEKFIDKYITCSLPDKNKEPELHDLVTSTLSHKHTFTCRKKKGVCCRFNCPWPPSERTHIVRGEGVTNEDVKKSKKIVEKVLYEITNIQETLCDMTLEDVLYSCGLSEEEYENAMDTMQKNTTIHYKRRPNEINIVPYNTVLLSLLKSNMNIQFVTGVYGLLTYLTAYLCKPVNL